MSALIEDLLNLSRIGRVSPCKGPINMTDLARAVIAELHENERAREVNAEIAPELTAYADANLLTIVLQNLLGNAWKYTAKRQEAHIVVEQINNGRETVYCVRDNGAGFDMAYADRLFAPFQRLHSDSEFAGTGIGLATVQRIIARHGGRIWAEAKIGEGAAFFFTLAERRG